MRERTAYTPRGRMVVNAAYRLDQDYYMDVDYPEVYDWNDSKLKVEFDDRGHPYVYDGVNEMIGDPMEIEDYEWENEMEALQGYLDYFNRPGHTCCDPVSMSEL